MSLAPPPRKATPALLLGLTLTLLPTAGHPHAAAATPTPDTPDASFHAGDPYPSGQLNAVAVQSTDKVLVGGRFTSWTGQTRTHLVRLHTDGSLDTGFASLPWTAAEIYDLAVDAQDRIYVCGQWNAVDGAPRPGVLRLTADGAFDASYPSDDRWILTRRLWLMRDGSLLANGTGIFFEGTRLENHAFMKLRPDGTPDRAFSVRFTDAGYQKAGVWLLGELPDGRVQIMGDPQKSGTNVRGVRLNLDGSPDPSWTTDITTRGLMTDLAVQADGGLLVAGNFSSLGKGLLRVSPDGKVDPAFSVPFEDDSSTFVRLDADGAIFFRWGSELWKLGPNGATNQNFKIDYNTGVPLDMAIDSRGRIVVAGTFQIGTSRPDASIRFSNRFVMRFLGRAANAPVDPPPARIPESFADIANRVFLRTAPNGNTEAFRLRPDNTFEPGLGYKTSRVDFTRANLPADQARLTFAATDTFNGVYSWRTNEFLLAFLSPTNGTYDLKVTLNTVPGVQQFSGPFELTSGSNFPPRITSEPRGGSYPAGQNVSALSVGALGFDLAYQWFQNGAAVAGATTPAFAFRPMDASRVGNWHVVVSNALGSVTSAVARISLASAPVITRQPVPMSAPEGGTARFSVEADGGGLNYEWLFGGVPAGLPNAPEITLSNLTPAQAGLWSVRISNNSGTVLSQPARLTVCSPALDHVWEGRPWVRILRSGDPVPGTPSTLGPLAAPFHPLFTLRNRAVHATARGNSEDEVAPTLQNALVRWRDGTLQTLIFTNTALPSGDGPFLYPFYPTEEGDGAVNFQDGGVLYEFRTTGITPILGPSTSVPGRPGLTFGPSGSFARRGQAVVISATINAGLIAGNPAGLFLHNAGSLSRIADETTDLPGVMTGYEARLTEDSVNFDGQTLVFSTVASLNGPGGVFRATLDGQITKLLDSGDLLPGLTNELVTFGDVDVEGGDVFAVVGMRNGASLVNRVVRFGPDGSAEVLASGDFLVAGGPRQACFGTSTRVQRWNDGVLETVIDNRAVLDCQRIARFFDVEAQGGDVAIGIEFEDGSAGIYASFGEPGAAALQILAQPTPVTAPATTPAVFSVAAGAPTPITYQWRRNGVALAGATGPILTIFGVSPADAGSYDVVLSAGGSTLTSEAVPLAILDAPTLPKIHVQPRTTSVPAGSRASLRVEASGAPPLTFQWRLGNQPLDDAHGPELSVVARTNASYQVVVSNASGSVTSDVATLVSLPVITAHPVPVTVAAGSSATFRVTATGFDALRYLWFRDERPMAGQTNATLTLENVQDVDAGSYSVQVSGSGGGSLRSNAARLTVTGGMGPAEIRLGTPALGMGTIRFHLQTGAGRTYQVQRTTSLEAPAWITVRRLEGDGTTREIVLPLDGGSGFFRIAGSP